MIHSCWKAVERSCHNSIYKASFPVFFSLVGMLVIFKTSHVTIWGPGKIKRAFTSIHISYSTVSSRPKSISCSPRDSPSVPFNWRPVPCAEKLIQSTKEPSTMREKSLSSACYPCNCRSPRYLMKSTVIDAWLLFLCDDFSCPYSWTASRCQKQKTYGETISKHKQINLQNPQTMKMPADITRHAEDTPQIRQLLAFGLSWVHGSEARWSFLEVRFDMSWTEDMVM